MMVSCKRIVKLSASFLTVVVYSLSSTPIFTFDLDAAIANVCWAPYSSTVLAAVTVDRAVSVPSFPSGAIQVCCVTAAG